jgi:energy-coupling factor transporter ATP-binding protein EcfA2
MLSIKPQEGAKQFAVIVNSKTRNIEEILHVVERNSYTMIEPEGMRQRLAEFCEDVRVEENVELGESLVRAITLKQGYELKPIPAHVSKGGSCQRTTLAIVGKSGSGKSFFTAAYVSAYHHMYPKNLVYYVSANPISSDPSYDALLEKDSFKKTLICVDIRTINSQIDSSERSNCLFVFDDILDVDISIAPEKLRVDLVEEKKKTFFVKEKARIVREQQRKRDQVESRGLLFKPLSDPEIEKRMRQQDPRELELKLSDNTALAKLNQFKGHFIKSLIRASIHDILKRGRKYGVSCITTTHRFFERDDTAQCSVDESAGVVLFPYGNVSKEKLVEFLRGKLCFNLAGARAVASRTYKQYEYLFINTSGQQFFFTSHHLEFL